MIPTSPVIRGALAEPGRFRKCHLAARQVAIEWQEGKDVVAIMSVFVHSSPFAAEHYGTHVATKATAVARTILRQAPRILVATDVLGRGIDLPNVLLG